MPIRPTISNFDRLYMDEVSPISGGSWTSLDTLQVRRVEHRCQMAPSTDRLLRELHRVEMDSHGRRDPATGHPMPARVPMELLRATAQELQRVATQTVRIEVPVHSPPVTPAPAPVTGITPEHMELLRKVVDMGVEWDMMGATEGMELLKSVGAVKPTPPRAEATFSTSASTSATMAAMFDTSAFATSQSVSRLHRPNTGRNVSYASSASEMNIRAAEAVARGEEIHRMMDINSLDNLRDVWANQTRMTYEELSSFLGEARPATAPIPMEREPGAGPVPTPYPPSRSRFSRPRGR